MTLEVISPTAALLDGRYVLEDRVGKGGMATVYRAEDTRLGRIVAIKMIHEGDSLLGSADRAHTEKALLASLSHPSLVTLFDAQLDPGRPRYLVMEFIDGPTLADRLATGPIPPVHLARIVRDLAEGLAAVHGAGIVHRDVKPSNVLMAQTGARGRWSAKLADFGIAYSLDDDRRVTTPGVVLGTLTYMAPEQLTDKDPGTPVDVFALGLIALEALTGESGYPPLSSGRAAAVARVMHPPTIAEHVDEGWRDLIERMTRLEPSERPTAEEVARAARALARRDSAMADSTPLFAPEAGTVSAGSPAGSAGAGTTASAAPGRTTEQTAVLPQAAREPSRVRRRVLFGAGALAAVGALATTAAMLNPVAVDGIPRMSAETVVRTLPGTDEAVAEPVAPEPAAPVQNGSTDVETAVDPSAPVDPSDITGTAGNAGKGAEKKAENAGPGNNNGNDKGNGKNK